MVHVLEGRHVFAQLTVEDNLRSGGFVRGLWPPGHGSGSGAHLHLVSPPENQAQDPGRADVRRRAADGRHRPGPDDASYFGTAR